VDDRRWGAGIRALRRPGIDTTFVNADRSEAFAAAMRAAAKAFSHSGAVRGFVFGVAARNLSQFVQPAWW
jgi:hypothetical protein